ncbi:MAG: hypothetical protein SR3Q1_12695 [Quinella sp. 3Q1]|nr:hypothetical protein [Quinella sp. 3Q1]
MRVCIGSKNTIRNFIGNWLSRRARIAAWLNASCLRNAKAKSNTLWAEAKKKRGWLKGLTEKLVKLRDRFGNHYAKAMNFVKTKEERNQLFELLWDGDEEQKVFTKEELLQDGVNFLA